MRKLGFIIGTIVLLIAVMPVSDSIPAQAAEPPPPVPQEIPKLPPPQEPLPVIDGHGTGARAPEMDLSYITGQRMPDGSMVGQSPVGQPLPASFDWRTPPNKVTSVKDQSTCGSCYAFAAIGNVESKILIDTNTTPPGPDYSENNAKECNWREVNNYQNPPGIFWGSCDGGHYYMLASLFSQKGIVRETDDPYVALDVACNSSCPYNKTLLDWRIISINSVPNTTVLKAYIQANGPVYTHLYVGDGSDLSWAAEFGGYDGSYCLYYAGPYDPNHAVLIVGWNDTLPHAGPGTGGWIVKNSWNTTWGNAGYFTIAYGSARIGEWSSYMYDWQDYDNNGSIYYYDDDYWTTSWGYGSTTGWGLCKFIPPNSTNATRVEFWTVDTTTDIDIYIWDDFNTTTTSLSNLLVSQSNYFFNEPGYHSVPLSSLLQLTAGDDVIVVVKFTTVTTTFPIPADMVGPSVTNLTYVSWNGANGSWTDLGAYDNDDVAIRLRTSAPSLNCTCGDICVNTTGWWRNGGVFSASATPIQDAVNNASAGDTICVKDGNYSENVDVNTANLTIKSENGTANCVVNATNSNDHVFEVTANHINITGFTVENATGGGKAGICLYGVAYCNISSNNATNNRCGIYLHSSSTNTLTDNIARNNDHSGIYLYDASGNTLTNNTCSSNSYGINVYFFCNNNTLTNNTASNNYNVGILLQYSSSNTVSDNTCSNNTYYGIYLFSSSSNTFTNNTASNNNDYGIYLQGSSNNTIYNNYFNNTNNAWDNGTNTWNITKTNGTNIIGGPYLGGNYWSDYNGSDTDGDGFGETPYNIAGGSNKDYLPLVSPPAPPTLTVNVTPAGKGDVNISGVTPSAYPNTTSWSFGENVTLEAVNSTPGWGFVNWSGNLMGSTNPTTVTMRSSKNVTAHFTEQGPEISFSPSNLSFSAVKGGANPANETLKIWNSGGGMLNWTLTDSAAWLSEAPMSGNSTGEHDNVTVSVNITGMSAGDYYANITISAAGASNTPQVVAVSLHISVPPPVWSVGDNWVYNCSYANPGGNTEQDTCELEVTVVGEEAVGDEDSYKLSGIFVPPATRDSADMPLTLHIGDTEIWNSKDHMEYLKQSLVIAELPGLPSTITWNYTGDYGWPYGVGKTWTFTVHTVAGPIDETVDREGKVLGVEAVTVPAGTFECYHIVTYDPASPGNYTFEHWFNATDVKSVVKEIDRSLWAGEETRELTSYSVETPPAQYNLTVNSTSGGNVTTPGEGTFACYAGEVVDLVAAADTGYQFLNWTGDVSTIAGVDSAATNIIMTGNYSITANFGEKGAEVDSEWGKVDTPNMDDWTIAPGADLYMPALGIDGQTIYVIGNMWEDENADGWLDFIEETARLWKSEDGGATWDDMTRNVMKEICDEVYSSDETIPWNEMVAWFNFVTVPMDDSSFIVLGAYLGDITDPNNWQQVVLVSADGGEQFEFLPYPIQDSSAGTELTDILGINVAPGEVDGVRDIAVGGIEDPDRAVVRTGHPDSDVDGRIYRYQTGGLVPGWADAATGKPGWVNCTAVTWVYFSGAFSSDYTVVAVTHNTNLSTPGWTARCAPDNDSYFQTGTWSGSNVNWNEAAGRGEAALLTTEPTVWWVSKGSTSAISLPLDYDGADKYSRYAWVVVNTAEGVDDHTVGTIYRVVNGNAEPVTQQVEGQPWLASVFYGGMIGHGKAVAGLLGTGHVTNVIKDSMAGLGLMTGCCEGVQVYRNDGISDMDICCQRWEPACKPPTGHGAAVAILAPPGFTKVYCVVTGLMIGMEADMFPDEPVSWGWRNMHMLDKYDESAFSVSFDEGDTWNQIGLIDTDMDYLTDVAQSPDCNTTYLASININLPGERNEHPLMQPYMPCGECDSVFFKAKNLAEAIPFAQGYDDKWFRVWNGELTNNTPLNGADTPEIGLIRLAPEETAEIQTVYFVDRGSDTVYYDGNKGLGCWETGSSTIDEISDLAVQDEATIYALGFDADVAVNDDHGYAASWSSTMDSKVDDGHTIAVLGEGNVLVGGADGKVSYSDDDLATFLDGEASFTELDDIGDAPGYDELRVHVAFDSYFDTNSVIYAAVSYVDVDVFDCDDPANDADNGIYRWVIDESTAFTDLGECAGTATPTETQLGLGPSCDTVEVGYYGIVLSNAEGNPETDATTGGVLYAAFFDADGNVTGVARCLNPAEEVACGEALWDYLIEDVNEYHGAFTVEPSSLKICGCLSPDTNSKLWTIDDALYYNGIVVEEDPRYDATLGRLWTYEDCYAKLGPVLVAPADGAVVPCDPYYWWNDAFALKWERQCDGCSYNIQIAYDEDFTGLLLDISGKDADCQEIDYAPPSGSNPSYLVAEGALGPGSCGTTFYWRVRSADAEIGEIIHSPWSETRSFTIAGETKRYNLTISSTDGGNVTTPGEGTFNYNAGKVVDLVATADSGYQLVNWTGDTGTIANVNLASTTITMIGNYSIIANFKELPPAIGVTPTNLPFIAGEGTDPDDGYLDIWNSGGGTLNWLVSDDVAWLSEAPMSGNSTGERDNVTVSANITGMSAGDYTANITISAAGASNTPQIIPVSLHIRPPPGISFSPASLSFSAVKGGANPANETFEIWNSGGGMLNWTLSDDAAWLSEAPMSGNSTGEHDNVTVSANITGMSAGDYYANITITAPGANNTPQVVAVSLHISPAPEISVSPSNLSFVTGPGEDPDPETLDIWNSGGGTLNWTVSDDAPWLTENPAGGSLGAGEHDYVTVSVNTSGMAAGMHHASITITGSADVTIPVTLEIKPAPIDVVRNLPDVTYPGDTFDVFVSFTAPADEFNAIGLTDLAPDGWEVAVDKVWCSPNADQVKATGNKTEIIWYGPYGNGTNFSAMYKVSIPDDAKPGISEFPLDDCSKAWLEYYVGSQGPYTSCVIGEHEMTVTVTIDVMRNLPDVALMPNETYPGDTFYVYVNFTAPVDGFNSIGLTDVAPDGWKVQVDKTWCWIDGSPASAYYVNALGNKAEIMLAGPFAAGKNISVMYKVTVPTTATPGVNNFSDCIIDESWLEYYFNEKGPYKSCIRDEYQMVITVPGDIVGETRDVNANELPDVDVRLFLAGTGYCRSDISTPDYINTANVTGEYYLVANKTRWYDINTTDDMQLPGCDFDIDLTTPELLAVGNTFNFSGDYGLIPRAPDMSYALKSVNLWKIGCAANPEYNLSEWKAMDVCTAWLYPS